MDSRVVIYLLLSYLASCTLLSSASDRGVEVQVSPDSEGGHHSSNHFSTPKMDDVPTIIGESSTNDHGPTVPTEIGESSSRNHEPTVPAEVAESSLSDREPIVPAEVGESSAGDHEPTVPAEIEESSKGSREPTIPPEVLHKGDAKKDPKKKVKPLKKKDKGLDHGEDSATTVRSPHRTTSTPELPSTVEDGGTSVAVHREMEDVTTTATTTVADSSPVTTHNENLLSSDEQPPATTIVVGDEAEKMIPETEAATAEAETASAETETTTTAETETITTMTTDTESTTMVVHTSTTLRPSDLQSVSTGVIESTSLTTFHPRSDTSTIDDVAETTTPTPPVVATEDSDDDNGLSNDLEDTPPTTTTTAQTMLSDSARRQKQLDLGARCPCDEGGRAPECPGARSAADPNCPCRQVCAGQNGQSCSPGEPCDEEFGLHCHPQNNTCAGPLSIRISDVTHDSARVTWGTSESELQPQALVSYATVYRGAHTQWSKVQDSSKGLSGMSLKNLLPGRDYFVKVEEDGKQEIATFRTTDVNGGNVNMPKILVKQRSPTTLTVVWDDFRLPSYHSEYVLEYRPARGTHDWTKVQAGTQTIVTVSGLTPSTPYEVKVAVWEDDRLELPSELITAYTADGCVREGRAYGVGDEFFLGCDFRCVCGGSNESDCSPRCDAPYVPIGSKTDDPRCYEKVVPSDPCCVTIRCTESKALEDLEGVGSKSGECPEILEGEEEGGKSSSCLSDCDHDSDCGGALKCCPSSCGGAVCVRPLHPRDVCEHVYCGPNAECVSSKMACVCSEGFEGDPHDFLSGCLPVNNSSSSPVPKEVSKNDTRAEFDLRGTTPSSSGSHEPAGESLGDNESGNNELGPHEPPGKGVPAPATDAPFELDLTHGSDPNGTLPKLGSGDAETNDTQASGEGGGGSVLFDGCEYNNVTYDRDARFEDGCDALCVCEGRGHVSCVPRCNTLSSGSSPACKEVPDPDDPCCRIMICSFPPDGPSSSPEHPDALPMKILSAQAQNGTSVRVRVGLSTSHLPTMAGRDVLEIWYRESSSPPEDLSQWHKRPVSQADLSEVQRGVFELDVSGLQPQAEYYVKVARDSRGGTGLNIAEFSNTVQVKTFPAAVKSVSDGCFHHNRTYALGEVFEQGCEHRCVCRERGFIECQDRCALYVDTVGYEGCEWVPSEEDPCCSVPLCNRRKIPLMIDGRPPLPGGAPDAGFCVADDSGHEVYRVGDIWESADGCRTRICRCTRLPNGTTSIQCQSECPPLPPNAHIPTARCPRPVLVKPDGPCKCPYVSCEEAPARHVVPPQCEYKGERYDVGREFYDGCLALCHCGRDLRVECAAVECPYHFGADFTDCLEWDIDPDFFPVPPHCCAPATCKNDGSCTFGGRKFRNFEDIPGELLPCGARCVCVNGNVTCENRCPPVGDVPPPHLPCPVDAAYKGHPPGETCCMQWMCRESKQPVVSPVDRPHCTFQGSRYLVGERWEVRKGSQQRSCTCHLSGGGSPEVECRGGCPQIPQRFLLPTDQCLRPVIVTPEDPLMCPYVVCNNTVSGQELYNVNVVALNSTAVRIRFSLSSILVGLIGHAELHFTADPTLPPRQWHVQKFSRPKRLFDSPNIEYVLNALRPNTTYFLRVRIRIDALQGGPESELFKLKMPPSEIPGTNPTPPTTTVQTTAASTLSPSPEVIEVDPRPEAHVIDARTARVSWRNLDPAAKRHLYALQLRYRPEGGGRWITTPVIHRDVTSYFLHDLSPRTRYRLEMVLVTTPPPGEEEAVPPESRAVQIVTAPSSRELQFAMPPAKEEEVESSPPPKKKEPEYQLRVSVEEPSVGADHSSFRLVGIPEPIPKHIHVIKIMYKTSSGGSSYSFVVPETDRVTLDHLEPGQKYVAQLELYLTDGRTLTSNEVEFVTKPAKKEGQVAKNATSLEAENVIGHGPGDSSKRAEQQLLSSSSTSSQQSDEEEGREAYFIALVVVAVVAAVAGFGFVLLLVLLVRRQASAKALPISRTPSESAYDNPTYKTYDGERPEDKTNGQTMQTTQA